MKKKSGHIIKEVYPDSIAEEMEIEPGDTLLLINNEEIEDVFDYRYMIKDEYVEVVIRKPDGEEWLLEIDKEYDDDLGVERSSSDPSFTPLQHTICPFISTWPSYSIFRYFNFSPAKRLWSILHLSSGFVVWTEILMGANCIRIIRSMSFSFILVRVI